MPSMLDIKTSMLYIAHMTKISLLEALQCGKSYSLKADIKMNAWAIVAVIFALAAPWLSQRHADLPISLRAALALSPLFPSLLYVRSIRRWNHSVDELQRRIQIEAALFATAGAIFFVTAISLLSGVGIFQATSLEHGLGFIRIFTVILFLYVLRVVVLSRRRQ
jgi:hypothetical protein